MVLDPRQLCLLHCKHVNQQCIKVITDLIDPFDSVSDLLDFISPDQDPKSSDAQKKHRRSKVSNQFELCHMTIYQ